jgi:arginase family enzyme
MTYNSNLNSNLIFTTINTPYDPINNVGVIKNDFDNIIDKEIYNSDNIYEQLYNNFLKIFNKEKIFINISTDRAISACTLSALNEKYMYQCGNKFNSDLKILYIDSIMDMELNNYEDKLSNNNYRNSIITNLLTLSTDEDITRTYTKHKLALNINQFIFLAQQQINSGEENILLNNNIIYYPYNTFKKNPSYIINKIINQINDSNLAIIFDMSVFDINIAPCVIREDYKNGLNLDHLNIICESLNKMNKKYNNIKMIDITGHYLALNDTSPAYRVTIETITKIYSKIFDMKEYAINIHNEYTRFLIFKPVDEICIEGDLNDIGDNYGWYILRNISKEEKEEILKEIDDDTIKIITINENNNEIDIMVSSTTIYEQNEKCYYTSTSYKDCTLYPDEKMNMMFELVNY